MILIGIGSNLPSPTHGPPQSVCEAALVALQRGGITLRQRSQWYESAPVPVSDQPWYVNGVVEVDTPLAPSQLLSLLHHIEADFGRVRSAVNAARVLDLDLLAYGNRVMDGEEGVFLPHPRMTDRAFVIRPLAEIAPAWRHPVTGKPIGTLISALRGDQTARPVQGGNAGETF